MQPQTFRAEPTALNYTSKHSLLVKALAELSYWQAHKNHYGFGEVTLDSTDMGWVVKVSDDLVSKIIPF
jgi:hypothetical protein